MNKIIKIIIILIFVYLPQNLLLFGSLPKNHPIYISLGRDCEAAERIRSFKIRLNAYPFDWNVNEIFDNVCSMLKNRFENFLDPKVLICHGNIVINTKYAIYFNHDFSTNPSDPIYTINQIPDDADHFYDKGSVEANYQNHLPEVTEKYNRRINRLLSLLDAHSTIFFIRTHITPQEAQQFVELMAAYYPLVDYTLLVTHNNQNLNYDWNIPHVINHYWQNSDPKQPKWMHPDEWDQLFTNLGFEKWKTN